VDDVINVSGHRIGTAEVENAINEDPAVIESAVVGYPHDIKGQGIYAFVICEQKPADEGAARASIVATVERVIGKVARPDRIQFVNGLPKTRSGKIMRRILRKVAEGDTANLAIPARCSTRRWWRRSRQARNSHLRPAYEKGHRHRRRGLHRVAYRRRAVQRGL
jgi:acyl-CoA synthetase (AMP-forming)/AMP-acid ligase II